ncbi:MAG: FAD:protein FMN transferase [Butyrivibrio sp.]
MKKTVPHLLLFMVLICIIPTLQGCSYNTPSTIHSAEGYYFDTYISVRLYGCGSSELAEEAVELCGRYEKIFSRTRSDFLLYELNEDGYMVIDSEDKLILKELIEFGKKYGEITYSALNIAIEPLSSLWDFRGGKNTVPADADIAEALGKPDYKAIEIEDNAIRLNGARLDLGAVAKGYAADGIRTFLTEKGVTSAIIDLGGNILCIGGKPTGEDFSVGIKRPFSEEILIGLNIDGLSVVTSGVYERYFEQDGIIYHHILDTATGMPCENGLLSVTIIAESGAVCDCLSTGCFVMGMEDAMSLIDNMDGVYGIFVDENYNIYYSEGAEALVK